ncbi:MAG: purine-binding chemotaxis protein CheW [Lachnospiraceae bacterium]|nr:purine-binding chemotaxis protein CheW [Lachnospiraceae bacterium]
MEDLMLADGSERAVETIQFIVINIGDEQYGIDIKYVDNIIRMTKIRRVPDVQHYFEGVINLRGEVVPVMSLRRKCDLPEVELTDDSRIIIIKLENNAPVGIIVDAVKEVVTLPVDCIGSPNANSQKTQITYLSGIGKFENRLISLLNLNAVIADQEAV